MPKHDDHKDREPLIQQPKHRVEDKDEDGDPLVMPLAEAGPGKPLVGATGVLGDHIDDGERDPHTIAEEQRIRSAAYEAGLEDPLHMSTLKRERVETRHDEDHRDQRALRK